MPSLNNVARNLLHLVSVIVFALVLANAAHAQDVGPEVSSAGQGVISDQISAFQSRDHERAFSHASPSIRDIFKTTDNFVSMVKRGYMPLYNPQQIVMGRSTIIGGQLHQEVIATDQNGKQWQAVYTLQQQPDGSWKINGVKMEPYTGGIT